MVFRLPLYLSTAVTLSRSLSLCQHVACQKIEISQTGTELVLGQGEGIVR